MQTTGVARQIYETGVKNLPVIERLLLVKLVMDDLMSSPVMWIVLKKAICGARRTTSI